MPGGAQSFQIPSGEVVTASEEDEAFPELHVVPPNVEKTAPAPGNRDAEVVEAIVSSDVLHDRTIFPS